MPSWEGKLGQAISLAAKVHEHQVDKSGKAYILHPLAVMQRATDYYMDRSDGWQLEVVQIVAVFHDMFEDVDEEHGWTANRLRNRVWSEYGDDVYRGVDHLTKMLPSVETYDEYIERCGAVWTSRIVKIADLSHNLDAFRLPLGIIGEKDFKRWDKYHRALVTLSQQEITERG